MSIFQQILYALTPGLFYIQQLSTPQYSGIQQLFYIPVSKALFFQQLSYPAVSTTHHSFSSLNLQGSIHSAAFLPSSI
jgi:hypothetical protein